MPFYIVDFPGGSNNSPIAKKMKKSMHADGKMHKKEIAGQLNLALGLSDKPKALVGTVLVGVKIDDEAQPWAKKSIV